MLESKPLTKRKRSVRFWIGLAAAILFGLPLLLYAIALAYVNFGFLNSTVTDRISKKLGVPAHIGSIRSNVFQSLSLNDIAIDTEGGGDALAIGATHLDFNLVDLLRNGHLRGLSVERPVIALRHDPITGWNRAFKFSPQSGESVRIDSVDIRDGTLAVLWSPRSQLKLTHIDAAFGSQVNSGSAPFKLHASLESGETIALETHSNTDGAFNGTLAAGFNFDRDLAALLGGDSNLKGLARIDMSASRTAQAPSDPIALSGAFHAGFTKLGELAPPEFKISGPISGSVVTVNGLANSAHIALELAGESSAKASVFNLASALFSGAAPKTAASIRADFARNDTGAWAATCNINDVSLPLDTLGRAANLAEKASLKLGGVFNSKTMRFDATAGSAAGSFTLNAAELRYIIPPRVLAEASKSLVASGNANYAMALNSLTQTGIKDISGSFSFTREQGKLKLTGHLAPVPVFATALKADFTEFTLPATDITLESTDAADGSCAIKVSVAWTGGQLTADLLRSGEKWTCDARLNENALPSEVLIEGTVDLGAATAGPFRISTDSFKLSALGPLLQSLIATDFNSLTAEARCLSIRIEPFSIDPAKPHALILHISAEEASSGVYKLSLQTAAIEITPDGVFLRSPLEWTDAGKPVRAEPQRLDPRALMRLFR